MKREVVITADGSSTIHLPEWDEQYHSKHGAIQEAYHVFIKHGLHYFCDTQNDILYENKCHAETVEASQKPPCHTNLVEVSILEIGFGTGLNAFISLLEAERLSVNIDYHGVEGYPVSINEINLLNYPKELKAGDKASFFKKLHDISWDEKSTITSNFDLTKHQILFSEIKEIDTYNLIYFDAFGARVQPELWTETIFQKMYDALKLGGVLVTYSAKGSVRRAMETVGFIVERLPGPLGKREMLRATKHSATPINKT